MASTSASNAASHSPFVSLIQQHKNIPPSRKSFSPASRKSTHKHTAPKSSNIARQYKVDDSIDPISSPSPSPPSSPTRAFPQVGLSVVIPDYLSDEFVLENIDRFKSSDHAMPKQRQQQRTPSYHGSGHQDTPARSYQKLPSLVRNLSDIIPDDISTQVAMQDLGRYKSTEYYRANGSSSSSIRSTPIQQDRVEATPQSNSTSSSPRATSTKIHHQPNRQGSVGFSPFKPLFPPPSASPPPTGSRSPSRRGTPKKSTSKKRNFQVSMIDDSDPIEDGDSDEDWQVFWTMSNKQLGDGNSEKRHRMAESPPISSNRQDSKHTVNHTALKPPEPLGPKLLQISREQIQSANNTIKTPTPAKQLRVTMINSCNAKPPLTSLQQTTSVSRKTSNPIPQISTSTLLDVALDPHIISYAPILTNIKDLSLNDPSKKYHLMGLIQIIAPVQDEIAGFAGKTTSRSNITICDRGLIHLNITLWGDKTKWIETCRVGDVVLLTDLATKEYRQKLTASTRWSSRMYRLDGTILDKYRGDAVIEDRLSDLLKMRETLGHHLLDNDRGIARDPSLYQTLDPGLILQQGTLAPTELSDGLGVQVHDDNVAKRDEFVVTSEPVIKVEAGSWTILPIKIEPASQVMPMIKAEPVDETWHLERIDPVIKKEPGTLTKGVVGNNTVGVLKAMTTPTLGKSIQGVVVYHKLITGGDRSKGWEIGAVNMTKMRFFKIQTSFDAPWIDLAKPQRLMQFYGQWSNDDGMLHIDYSTREPIVILEKGPDLNRSSMKIMKFESVQRIIESQFMGVALVEGYINGVTFPANIMDQFWEEESVFSIPHIVCSYCDTVMEPSEDDPTSYFCAECQLEPNKQEKSKMKWCYHAFQFRLGDKPWSANDQQTNTIRVSCKGDVGQQVFPTIPATKWSKSLKNYRKCREEWITWMKMLAGQPVIEVKSSNNDSAQDRNAKHRRVQVEIGVGKGRMGKAVRVKYLQPLSS
ncbi:hypothetical protein FBU30_010261 [Linnemannia zychae]|nr:hypothetical protein FBU30_010261 [Linnemannia zychae]